jgi:hypothetical protein
VSGDDNLERRLEAWLEATARPMPPDLLDDVVATAHRVPRSGVRAEFPSSRRWQLAGGALVAVVVLAVVGAALRAPLQPGASVIPTPSSEGASTPPSPGPSPSIGSTASPAAQGLQGWHRNNYNSGEERLSCREGADTWTCTYEVPDGTGSFVGQNVTDAWTCPAWFPDAICNNATAVYRGVFLCCLNPQGQPSATPTTVNQELVITQVAGQEVMQLYWVDRFVCPWYRTFEEALAHDFTCPHAP